MKMYQEQCALELRVNGDWRKITARPADLLLDLLREQLGLTGAKAGCRNGDCGACTVIMDGWPVKSCLVLAVEAEGHDILTVEGLGDHAAIQQAFVEAGAFQCGYCTSGFLMACHALSLQRPQADEFEAESWLQSNICRCTSLEEIRQALKSILQPGPSIDME